MNKRLPQMLRLAVITACVLPGAPRAASAHVVTPPGVAGTLPLASKTSLADQTARPHVFADPDWFHWGGTPVLGDDGTYHLFYDRWPRTNPRLMRGWLYESQIAHATAAAPEGPYTFADIALQSPGDTPAGRWDACNAHNAYCVRLADPATGKPRYYLYYVANRDDNSAFNDWYDHIITQRIGVAVADSPGGPWKREAHPACTPQAPLLGYVVNPAVTRLPGGKYLMLLKGRAADQPAGASSDKMGPYRTGWALADAPTGPFTIQPSLLFETSGAGIEDPCVFIWNGLIYAAVKDARATSTGGIGWAAGSLAADGFTITWTIPASSDPGALITPRTLTWADSSTTPLNTLERPFILQDKSGRPTHLFAAAAQQNPFLQPPRTADQPGPPFVLPGPNLPFNVCIPLGN